MTVLHLKMFIFVLHGLRSSTVISLFAWVGILPPTLLSV